VSACSLLDREELSVLLSYAAAIGVYTSQPFIFLISEGHSSFTRLTHIYKNQSTRVQVQWNASMHACMHALGELVYIETPKHKTLRLSLGSIPFWFLPHRCNYHYVSPCQLSYVERHGYLVGNPTILDCIKMGELRGKREYPIRKGQKSGISLPYRCNTP
jgi:hypothetical protein